uniref:Putative ceramide kinase n=1 Tax=Anopheles marajoara TaxID=58244 RepID=A0A2M4BGZ6_9DIPT
MDKEHEVLLNGFVIAKKRYRVYYNAGILVWEEEAAAAAKKAKVAVPITDVLSVVLSNRPNPTGKGRKRWLECSNSAKAASSSSTSSSSRSAKGASDGGPHDSSLDSDRIPVLSSSLSSTTTTNTLATSSHSNRESSDELSNSDVRHEGDFYGDGNKTAAGKYLIIHYATLVCPKTSRWRVKNVALHNTEQRIVDHWYSRLTDDLRDQNRPKNLLLFLNPYGGKKNALALYERFAKPLFRLADVDVNLIITQRAQQIYDIVTSKGIALGCYDGLVCCGGDGTFAELFNGLVARTMADLGLDVKHPPYLPKPNIPIGVIPAGSTDTVAYCLNGTTDIKTSIIHIILGQHSGLDISAVYDATSVKQPEDQPGVRPRPELLKLYASVLSYGYLGDIAYDSEKYRWMGPKRYDYSGFKKFLRNRGYDGEIVVNIDRDGKHDPNDGVRCVEKCSRCHRAIFGLRDSNVTGGGSSNDGDENSGEEQIVITGKFLMVNGANISCSCQRSPQGFSPFCHLGDGQLDLVIVRHTSLFNNLRLLLTMTSKSKKIADLPFVEIYRTKEFRFTTPYGGNSGAGERSRLSRWNCDGEVLLETNIIVESNCQLVNVFRRGIIPNRAADTMLQTMTTPSTAALPNDDKGSSCFGLCK